MTPKTGYHLLPSQAVPEHFWQQSGEDQTIVTRLTALATSMQCHGVCWLMWNTDKAALYEQRDLYQCAVVKVVEHDVIRGKAIPCGNLCRRESLSIFFSVSQFWQILGSSETDPSRMKGRSLQSAVSAA